MPRKPKNAPPDVTPKNVLTRMLKDSLPGFRLKKDPAYQFETSRQDKKWLDVVPCKRGGKISGVKANIYVHSSTHLGYIGKGIRILRELLETPGVQKWQVGDEEFSVIFPDSAALQVAGIVKAYPKRRSSKNTPVLEK